MSGSSRLYRWKAITLPSSFLCHQFWASQAWCFGTNEWNPCIWPETGDLRRGVKRNLSTMRRKSSHCCSCRDSAVILPPKNVPRALSPPRGPRTPRPQGPFYCPGDFTLKWPLHQQCQGSMMSVITCPTNSTENNTKQLTASWASSLFLFSLAASLPLWCGCRLQRNVLISFCPWGVFHFHLEYCLIEQREALVSQKLWS